VVGTAGSPGSYLVNTIPICDHHSLLFPPLCLTNIIVRHLPEWFPGAGFKKKARIWKKGVKDMPTIPFQFVKKELVSFPFLIC
jgi:hypothetical protein